jgi:glutamate dehydrogenase (NAD(P)+)
MRVDELGPEAVIEVANPVVGMRGVLVIDNSVNGPAGGGTRMCLDLTVDEVMGLARAMTYKWAIFDLPTGGSKAGIFGDPMMPAARKREILHAFGHALSPYLRDTNYLLGVGPDMGIEGADADEIYAGAGARNVVTWESPNMWSIDGDDAGYHLTGCGVASSARAALESIDRPIEGATFAIEGFGQVGAGTARYVHRDGGKVVAVSTLLGAIHDPDGLDVERLLELRRAHGDACVQHYGGTEVIEPHRLFGVPVDVLIPGARPRAIDAYNEGRVSARVVCPAGNLSVTVDAEERLHRRGIVCVPDFVANGGGIIATWVDIIGGDATQALEAVRRMCGTTAASVLGDARRRDRTPAGTARERVRDRILSTQRREIPFAEATARAKEVLAVPPLSRGAVA